MNAAIKMITGGVIWYTKMPYIRIARTFVGSLIQFNSMYIRTYVHTKSKTHSYVVNTVLVTACKKST